MRDWVVRASAGPSSKLFPPPVVPRHQAFSTVVGTLPFDSDDTGHLGECKGGAGGAGARGGRAGRGVPGRKTSHVLHSANFPARQTLTSCSRWETGRRGLGRSPNVVKLEKGRARI